MHDLGFFRANYDQVAARLATRGPIAGLDQFREMDQRRRAVITEAEELKARRNAESAEIAKVRKARPDQFHARCTHPGAWVYRGSAAISGQFNQHVRNRTAPQIRR